MRRERKRARCGCERPIFADSERQRETFTARATAQRHRGMCPELLALRALPNPAFGRAQACARRKYEGQIKCLSSVDGLGKISLSVGTCNYGVNQRFIGHKVQEMDQGNLDPEFLKWSHKTDGLPIKIKTYFYYQLAHHVGRAQTTTRYTAPYR